MKAKSYIQNATHLSHQVDPSDAQGANHPQHHHQAAAHKSVPYKHGDHDGKDVSDLTRGDPGHGSLVQPEVGSEFRHTGVKINWKGPFWEYHA